MSTPLTASRPDQDRRDALILEHIPLLHHIVGRMGVEISGRVEREDLLGYGMLGLIAAADSFEPERGLKFSTYAFTRIRGAILDELRKQDFLSRGQRDLVKELDRHVKRLEQSLQRPASPEELAEAMGVGAEEIDTILLRARQAGHTSLDEGPSRDLMEMLEDPRSADPVGSAEWAELKDLLVEMITELPDQEKTVITLYYGEELMLRDIASILGVTESRVSQIHTRALYRLNGMLKAAGG
ncbi:MAG: FliA/WhiG family RNA polymerase sigma factor [Planctomycetes bacterium]|nr:FliA/WhiG family RNA polymerase sigma factor [Planctomycetota bacterium]